MKKKVLVLSLLVVFCLVLVGCKKDEEPTNDGGEKLSGGWETVMATRLLEGDSAELKAFTEASKNYTEMKLEPIAFLGEQVVAGKNYMFFAKGYKDGEKNNVAYKIVVVYKDLDNKSSITSVKDFDYSKYVSKSIDYKAEELSGGWTAVAPERPSALEDANDHEVFTKAIEGLAGVAYAPVAVVAKQVVAGTNYAILSLGKTSTNPSHDYLFLLTIYKDLEGNVKLSNVAYIDLADLA